MMNDHTSMDHLPVEDQARRALLHILTRIREDARVAWYMGAGTESFAKATEAYAALTCRPVRAVREEFYPLASIDPAKEAAQEVAAAELELNSDEADLLRQTEGILESESLRLITAEPAAGQAYEALRRCEQLDAVSSSLGDLRAKYTR